MLIYIYNLLFHSLGPINYLLHPNVECQPTKQEKIEFPNPTSAEDACTKDISCRVIAQHTDARYFDICKTNAKQILTLHTGFGTVYVKNMKGNFLCELTS